MGLNDGFSITAFTAHSDVTFVVSIVQTVRVVIRLVTSATVSSDRCVRAMVHYLRSCITK
ncbi:MAG: hypothetical protein KME27_02215 [Lyngbya sp. HA4199-MV5]|nr:hypothetical protein [Lyngbya sp. HA4199-MV5]